jgi:hypothetical protein
MVNTAIKVKKQNCDETRINGAKEILQVGNAEVHGPSIQADIKMCERYNSHPSQGVMATEGVELAYGQEWRSLQGLFKTRPARSA